jgi:hypothetical protein
MKHFFIKRKFQLRFSSGSSGFEHQVRNILLGRNSTLDMNIKLGFHCIEQPLNFHIKIAPSVDPKLR